MGARGRFVTGRLQAELPTGIRLFPMGPRRCGDPKWLRVTRRYSTRLERNYRGYLAS